MSLTWKKFANGSTPKSANIKGDKFVGNYYIMFDKVHKEQMNELIDSGIINIMQTTSAQIFD